MLIRVFLTGAAAWRTERYNSVVDRLGGSNHRMSSKALKVVALDGKAVFCQTDKCDRPAVFLFSFPELNGGCLALCETHANERAARAQLGLPSAKPSSSEASGQRGSEAVA
jgi:hypothetical protein